MPPKTRKRAKPASSKEAELKPEDVKDSSSAEDLEETVDDVIEPPTSAKKRKVNVREITNEEDKEDTETLDTSLEEITEEDVQTVDESKCPTKGKRNTRRSGAVSNLAGDDTEIVETIDSHVKKASKGKKSNTPSVQQIEEEAVEASEDTVKAEEEIKVEDDSVAETRGKRNTRRSGAIKTEKRDENILIATKSATENASKADSENSESQEIQEASELDIATEVEEIIEKEVSIDEDFVKPINENKGKRSTRRSQSSQVKDEVKIGIDEKSTKSESTVESVTDENNEEYLDVIKEAEEINVHQDESDPKEVEEPANENKGKRSTRRSKTSQVKDEVKIGIDEEPTKSESTVESRTDENNEESSDFIKEAEEINVDQDESDPKEVVEPANENKGKRKTRSSRSAKIKEEDRIENLEELTKSESTEETATAVVLESEEEIKENSDYASKTEEESIETEETVKLSNENKGRSTRRSRISKVIGEDKVEIVEEPAEESVTIDDQEGEEINEVEVEMLDKVDSTKEEVVQPTNENKERSARRRRTPNVEDKDREKIADKIANSESVDYTLHVENKEGEEEIREVEVEMLDQVDSTAEENEKPAQENKRRRNTRRLRTTNVNDEDKLEIIEENVNSESTEETTDNVSKTDGENVEALESEEEIREVLDSSTKADEETIEQEVFVKQSSVSKGKRNTRRSGAVKTIEKDKVESSEVNSESIEIVEEVNDKTLSAEKEILKDANIEQPSKSPNTSKNKKNVRQSSAAMMLEEDQRNILEESNVNESASEKSQENDDEVINDEKAEVDSEQKETSDEAVTTPDFAEDDDHNFMILPFAEEDIEEIQIDDDDRSATKLKSTPKKGKKDSPKLRVVPIGNLLKEKDVDVSLEISMDKVEMDGLFKSNSGTKSDRNRSKATGAHDQNLKRKASESVAKDVANTSDKRQRAENQDDIIVLDEVGEDEEIDNLTELAKDKDRMNKLLACQVTATKKCWKCDFATTTLGLVNDAELRLVISQHKEEKEVDSDALKSIQDRLKEMERMLKYAGEEQSGTKNPESLKQKSDQSNEPENTQSKDPSDDSTTPTYSNKTTRWGPDKIPARRTFDKTNLPRFNISDLKFEDSVKIFMAVEFYGVAVKDGSQKTSKASRPRLVQVGAYALPKRLSFHTVFKPKKSFKKMFLKHLNMKELPNGQDIGWFPEGLDKQNHTITRSEMEGLKSLRDFLKSNSANQRKVTLVFYSVMELTAFMLGITWETDLKTVLGVDQVQLCFVRDSFINTVTFSQAIGCKFNLDRHMKTLAVSLSSHVDKFSLVCQSLQHFMQQDLAQSYESSIGLFEGNWNVYSCNQLPVLSTKVDAVIDNHKREKEVQHMAAPQTFKTAELDKLSAERKILDPSCFIRSTLHSADLEPVNATESGSQEEPESQRSGLEKIEKMSQTYAEVVDLLKQNIDLNLRKASLSIGGQQNVASSHSTRVQSQERYSGSNSTNVQSQERDSGSNSTNVQLYDKESGSSGANVQLYGGESGSSSTNVRLEDDESQYYTTRDRYKISDPRIRNSIKVYVAVQCCVFPIPEHKVNLVQLGAVAEGGKAKFLSVFRPTPFKENNKKKKKKNYVRNENNVRHEALLEVLKMRAVKKNRLVWVPDWKNPKRSTVVNGLKTGLSRFNKFLYDLTRSFRRDQITLVFYSLVEVALLHMAVGLDSINRFPGLQVCYVRDSLHFDLGLCQTIGKPQVRASMQTAAAVLKDNIYRFSMACLSLQDFCKMSLPSVLDIRRESTLRSVGSVHIYIQMYSCNSLPKLTDKEMRKRAEVIQLVKKRREFELAPWLDNNGMEIQKIDSALENFDPARLFHLLPGRDIILPYFESDGSQFTNNVGQPFSAHSSQFPAGRSQFPGDGSHFSDGSSQLPDGRSHVPDNYYDQISPHGDRLGDEYGQQSFSRFDGGKSTDGTWASGPQDGGRRVGQERLNPMMGGLQQSNSKSASQNQNISSQQTGVLFPRHSVNIPGLMDGDKDMRSDFRSKTRAEEIRDMKHSIDLQIQETEKELDQLMALRDKIKAGLTPMAVQT